jgi:Mor family transcriptional regulator/very-short-patch-repair endonuclease
MRFIDLEKYKEEIIRHYNQGETLNSLSKKFSTDHKLIRKLLVLNNVQLRSHAESVKIGVFKVSKKSNLYKKKEEIIKEYKSGSSALHLSKKYGCSGTTIIRFLRENNISLIPKSYFLKRPRGSKADKFANEIITLYKNGNSLEKISRKLNLKIGTVRGVLLRNNIQLRHKGWKIETHSKLDPFKNELIDDYIKGLSISELAKKYSLASSSNIYIYLRRRGVKTRNVKENFELKNKEKANRLIADYEKGDTLRNLVKKYGFSRNKIRDILAEKGITIKTRSGALKIAYSKKPKEFFKNNYEKYLKKYTQTHKPWDKGKKWTKLDKNKDLILKMYKDGKTTTQIAKIYNCSGQTVLKLLKMSKIYMKKSYRKGLTFEEEFGKEKAEEIRKKIKTARSKQVILPETKKKLSKLWKTPEKQKFARERIIRQYKSGKFPKQSNTGIELLLKKELIKRGYKENIDFICQFNLNDKFACDFCFPKQKLIIECDGDWWHANPEKYDRSTLHYKQKKTVEKDNKKNAYIRKIDNGSWSLVRFWESYILKDVSKCVDIIEQKLVGR